MPNNSNNETEATETDYYPPIPNEYSDELVSATSQIVLHAGTLGVPMDIKFNLLFPTALGRLRNLLSGNRQTGHNDRITMTVTTDDTQDGRTALGRLFCHIDEKEEIGLSRPCPIRFYESSSIDNKRHYVGQAVYEISQEA